MTDDLNARFEAAQAHALELPAKPDNMTLLKIYGLFKQATAGDNTAPKPSFSDVVARAKWEAWTHYKGVAADDAKSRYITLIDTLRAG